MVFYTLGVSMKNSFVQLFFLQSLFSSLPLSTEGITRSDSALVQFHTVNCCINSLTSFVKILWSNLLSHNMGNSTSKGLAPPPVFRSEQERNNIVDSTFVNNWWMINQLGGGPRNVKSPLQEKYAKLSTARGSSPIPNAPCSGPSGLKGRKGWWSSTSSWATQHGRAYSSP